MTLVFSIMLSSKHLACFFEYYQDCIQEDNEPYAYPYPSLDNLRKRFFGIKPHLRFPDFLPYTLLWLSLSRQLESARLRVPPVFALDTIPVVFPVVALPIFAVIR